MEKNLEDPRLVEDSEDEQMSNLHPVDNAKLKSINPVAFRSKKNNDYARLNARQRYESSLSHGLLSRDKMRNFVVKKPLAPNILDVEQAKKIRERSGGIKRVSVQSY